MPCRDLPCGDVSWSGHVFSLVIPPVIEKMWRGYSLKAAPSWVAQITGNKITPPRRMVLLVSPWHSFEHTQYSTLGFTLKSQNRANVVAGECQCFVYPALATNQRAYVL